MKPVFVAYCRHSVSAYCVNAYSMTETGHARQEMVVDLASGTGRGQEMGVCLSDEIISPVDYKESRSALRLVCATVRVTLKKGHCGSGKGHMIKAGAGGSTWGLLMLSARF